MDTPCSCPWSLSHADYILSYFELMIVLFHTGNNSGLSKPSQLRMEDITMPQGNI